MKRRILVMGALASILLLSGCSAFSGSSSSSSSSSSAESPGSPSSDGGTAAGSAERDASALIPEAQIVTTGTIDLIAAEPVAVADRAVALTTSLGGHVDSRTERSTGEQRADLVLRVPSAKVTEAVDGLKQLATVDSVSITATDVTAQVSDVEARITALQTSVARLLDLMSKATDTTDLIALESTLSERQADLDSLVAQRTAITDTVQYSSLTVSIDGPDTVSAAPGDFWSGLGTGWSSLLAALAGSLVAFGVALPWLVALAVIAAIVLLVIRLASRRTRRAPPTQTPS